MNRRQIKKLFTKLDIPQMLYRIGFSGQGTTLIDKKPESKILRNKSLITWREQIEVNKLIEFESRRRKNAFRQAYIDVLGEDPETDWQ